MTKINDKNMKNNWKLSFVSSHFVETKQNKANVAGGGKNQCSSLKFFFFFTFTCSILFSLVGRGL